MKPITKAAALRASKDVRGIETFSQPLLAAGACIALAKGITIDVDEKMLPLSCVRLTGDLSCYWVPDALVDLHPGEKGVGGGRHSGGGSGISRETGST